MSDTDPTAEREQPKPKVWLAGEDGSSRTEEAGSVPTPEQPEDKAKEGQRSFFKSARRDLDEKELSTPAARRFLIAEIDRLTEETNELKRFRNSYYNVDKQLAVFQEASKTSGWYELLSFACLSIGSAGLGAAPGYLSISSYGWVFVILSALLLAAGVAARVWR